MPPKVCQLLLVEDDNELRSAMADALIDQGYEVLEAENGEAALAAARAGLPALILLDLMMPVMDGWTFLRRRSADPGLRTIPVIVLSAHTPADLPVEVEVIAVLKKPPDLTSLIAMIETVCGDQR